jgi:hypothetical protein
MTNSARYYVLMTEQFGRAVFAEKKLEANEVVMYCEVLVLSEKDTPVVNSTDLKWYTFTFNDKQDCLVLGDGEIFNHDDNANVKYELITLNNRPMMVFTTTRSVDKDKQLFIDYNADVTKQVDEVLKLYNVNLI